MNRVRTVTGKPVGVKFVAGDPTFLDDWFTECIAHPEGCPDYIQVDGGEGGSGAAPASLMDYVGMPITLALPQVARGAGEAWADGSDPYRCLGQTGHAGQGRMGSLHGRRFRFLRPRLHVHWAASRQ